MYLLAEIFPFLRRVKLPFSRDQFILLLAAFNFLVLGVDTYLAHDVNGAVRGNMWIPIFFGPAAGMVLLAAGLVAVRRRMAANLIATLVFLASMVIAVLGSFFHLYRGLLPDAPAGQTVTAILFVYAPPLLSPATFALVGLLVFSAAWEEAPTGSGSIRLFGQRQVTMPYPKTQAYFLMTGMFILATVISSVLDHARTNFVNPWLWLPTFAGMFAVVVCCAMGVLARFTKADLVTYLAAMLLLVAVGLVGAILHLERNLTESGTLLGERFLRGAPMLAPLLFANMGLLGLLVLLDPNPAR